MQVQSLEGGRALVAIPVTTLAWYIRKENQGTFEYIDIRKMSENELLQLKKELSQDLWKELEPLFQRS